MEILLIAWIVLLPFIMLYGAYEGVKIYWLWIGGFFLTIFWIVQLLRSKNFSISRSGIWLLLWIAVLGVASLTGIHPIDSFVGGSYRHQGVLFFITLFLIGETVRLFSARSRIALLTWLGVGVVIESIIVLFQSLSLEGVRPVGTFGEPNAAAGYLAVGLYWIFMHPKAPRWLQVILVGTVLVAIVMTQSRTGIVTAAIVIGGIGLNSLLKRGINSVLVTVIAGILLVGSLLGYTYVRVISITRSQSQFENRAEFWRVGWEEFSKRPILGFGAESEERVYEKAYADKSFPLADFMIDRSHNIFLDVALWSGIVGLGVFVGWLFAAGYRLIASHNMGGLIVLLAWIVFASLQPVGVVQWVQLILLLSLSLPQMRRIRG